MRWLVIVIIPIGFIGIFSRIAFDISNVSSYTIFYLILQFLVIIIFYAGYYATKKQRAELGRILVVLGLEVILVVTGIFAEDSSAIIRSFYYFTLPILLSSVFTSKRVAIIITMFDITFILIYVQLDNFLSMEQAIGPVAFLIIILPIILVSTYYRDLIESDRLEYLRYYDQREEDIVKLEIMGKHVGGIVHDFNNLLTIIQGNIEIMLAIIHDDQSAEQTIIAVLSKIKEIQKTVSTSAELNIQILQDTEMLLSSIQSEEKMWITSIEDPDSIISKANIVEYLDDVRRYIAKFDPTV